MAILKLNNNSLTSVTELPSGVGSDPNTKVSLARLGLRVFANQNLATSNTQNLSYDVFQDSTGIQNLTNCTRNAGEFMSTLVINIPTSLKILINGNDSNCKDLISDTNGSFTGGAQQDTNTKKFGAGSVKLPDNGYITYGNALNSASISENEDYSWDAFVYHDDTYNTEAPLFTIGRWNYSGHNNTSMVRLDEHGQSKITIDYRNGTSSSYSLATSANAIPDNQWFHIAFGRQSNSHYLWVDGSLVSFASTSGSEPGSAISFSDATYGFNFGRSEQQGQEFDGWVDDFRWYKGTNIWGTDASISVPTEEQSLNTTNATGSFEGVDVTAPSSVSKMGAVITYEETGTNVLNTDIVMKLSADSGSNFTTATLEALPDFASGVKCAKISDTSVTPGTACTYQINFANQSDGVKEAKITGVALTF